MTTILIIEDACEESLVSLYLQRLLAIQFGSQSAVSLLLESQLETRIYPIGVLPQALVTVMRLAQPEVNQHWQHNYKLAEQGEPLKVLLVTQKEIYPNYFAYAR